MDWKRGMQKKMWSESQMTTRWIVMPFPEAGKTKARASKNSSKRNGMDFVPKDTEYTCNF